MYYNPYTNSFYSIADYNPFTQNYENFSEPPAAEYEQIGEVAFPPIQEVAESLTKRKPDEDPEEFEQLAKRIKHTGEAQEIDPSSVEGVDPKYIFTDINEDDPVYLTLPELETATTGHELTSKESGPSANRTQPIAFSQEQNKYIVDEINAGRSYDEIAREMHLKPMQIRNHWNHSLAKKNPGVKYQPKTNVGTSIFTEQDDKDILFGIAVDRKSYTELAQIMNRTADQIKNHWNYYKKKHNLEIKYRPLNKEIYEPLSLPLPEPKTPMTSHVSTGSLTNRVRRVPFTEKEDQEILDELRKGGSCKTVAEKLNRGYDEVTERWNYYLAERHPDVTNRWSRRRKPANTSPPPTPPQPNPIPNPYPYYYPYPYPTQQVLTPYPIFYWKV